MMSNPGSVSGDCSRAERYRTQRTSFRSLAVEKVCVPTSVSAVSWGPHCAANARRSNGAGPWALVPATIATPALIQSLKTVTISSPEKVRERRKGDELGQARRRSVQVAQKRHGYGRGRSEVQLTNPSTFCTRVLVHEERVKLEDEPATATLHDQLLAS